MGESGSESDIWEYKPLRRTKKLQGAVRCCSLPRKPSGTKGKRGVQKPKGAGCRDVSAGVGAQEAGGGLAQRYGLSGEPPSCQPPGAAVAGKGGSVSDGDVGEHTGGCLHFCPNCQMPFSMLVAQSPRWHVSECLQDTAEKDECPHGFLCSSSIQSHYREYSHFLLAHSRAVGGEGVASLKSCPDSVDSPSSPTPSQQSSAQPTLDNTHSNALLLLRSPTSGDIRKRKGWSPGFCGGRSVPWRVNVTSTPRSGSVREVPEGMPSSLASPSPCSNDVISYSPISTFPTEVQPLRSVRALSRKVLFSSDTTGLKADEGTSLMLHCSAVSSEDDLLAESPSLECQGSLVPSLAPANCLFGSNTGVDDSDQPKAKACESPTCDWLPAVKGAQWCSSGNQVLEQLRQQLQGRAEEGIPVRSSQEGPMENTAPRKTRAKGASSTLKQMDIGIFFGLQPLKKKEQEGTRPLKEEKKEVRPEREVGTAQEATLSSVGGQRAGGRQQRKRKATGSLGGEEADGAAAATERTERPHRKRWAHGRGSKGSSGQWRRCPFYKKIPGTGFVVDAFEYGHMEGVTCYFLTHFHSDHYGGLNRSSTFPIYCSRITANLVKTKLRVAEQYVHELPMNTECLVEGIKVVLLDANHCPGAAMLLFLLPDGQTVLHTGDFRADPSMEQYPELQVRQVQTLYLDTTYCSPEYTFPPQHEVVTFAANVAFEHVTVNPRTLVVCGAYSVGKEKIFLALAEVLGCKAALSRDKFSIMGCLESERISRLVTTQWAAARVHVLPMMQVNFKGLKTHLRKFAASYDQVLAFKPTGWTFSNQTSGVENIQPAVQDNVTIYGVPYSEHSSYLELKSFVQWLRPQKIIATVNVGNWASRKAMQSRFSAWRAECQTGTPGPGTA